MTGEPAGDVRAEAERLVAAALGAASVALRGLRDGTGPAAGVAGAAARLLSREERHVATGTVECCVCPVCRLIAAVRDPSPQLALRLATGAGDLAAGLAGVLRAIGAATARPPRAPAGPRREPDGGAAWRAATRADPPAPAGGEYREPAPDDGEPLAAPLAAEPGDPWRAATR